MTSSLKIIMFRTFKTYSQVQSTLNLSTHAIFSSPMTLNPQTVMLDFLLSVPILWLLLQPKISILFSISTFLKTKLTIIFKNVLHHTFRKHK